MDCKGFTVLNIASVCAHKAISTQILDICSANNREAKKIFTTYTDTNRNLTVKPISTSEFFCANRYFSQSNWLNKFQAKNSKTK